MSDEDGWILGIVRKHIIVESVHTSLLFLRLQLSHHFTETFF